MKTLKTSAIVLGMASAIALTAVPASAGPLMPNQAAVKAAAPDQGTDVQWRRHRGWGPAVGIGAGIAAGALIGSAVASRPYYGGYYYEEPVYAAPYAYDAPYAYEPVAPTWGYGYRGSGYCEEGYRRVPCSGN
jgi:hypothetical protein